NYSEPLEEGEAEIERFILIDNFEIKEATIDLEVKYTKEFQISSLAEKIKFFMSINNSGTYITAPSTAKFYISADATLDGLDFYLGETALNAIRPQNSHYINESFTAPENLENYQYLIYKLDDANTNTETNENNNTGAWPLALNSINTYPYINEFE